MSSNRVNECVLRSFLQFSLVFTSLVFLMGSVCLVGGEFPPISTLPGEEWKEIIYALSRKRPFGFAFPVISEDFNDTAVDENSEPYLPISAQAKRCRFGRSSHQVCAQGRMGSVNL